MQYTDLTAVKRSQLVENEIYLDNDDLEGLKPIELQFVKKDKECVYFKAVTTPHPYEEMDGLLAFSNNDNYLPFYSFKIID